MKHLVNSAVVVLVALSFACSGDDGVVVATVGENCPQGGVKTCGENAVGQEAVLLCTEGVLTWEIEEVCLQGCTFDNQEGATCKSETPDDAIPITPDDTREPDQVGDVVEPEDVADLTGEDTPDLPTPDDIYEVTFKDLMPDMTPPWIESTTPENQQMGVAMPFVVLITFTEPIHAVTIADQTVKMTDHTGKKVPINFEFIDDENQVLQLTPTAATFHGSPYTVTLDPMIKDVAGNMMGNNFQFTFYTEALPGLEPYHDLAAQYAPTIYQATDSTDPEYDYLTAYDLDGNWIAEDNVQYVKGTPTKFDPYVHYSVTETKSHFFIFYIFFYPYRNDELESNRFGNDVSGAQVIVRKSDNAPIAVETYFKQESDERSFSFLTEESGLVTEGKTFTDYKFDGQYPQATLFPENRYLAYLSARKHESCLWLDENNGFLDGCELNVGIKASMQKIEYVWKDGVLDPIHKEGSKFPQAKANVGFGLVHILESWWPRRGDVGTALMWATEYDYEPHTSTIYQDRPTLAHKVPSVFVDPIGNDNGRPPWAWKHNPQNLASFYDMPRGVWFLDPAVHFKQRHDQSNNWPGWDGEGGYSLEYCFNPYFNLDFRGIWPECTEK